MELKSLFNRKTVLKRTVSLFLVGAAAVAFQGVAFGHSLSLIASASCTKAGPVITYTVTSWDQFVPNDPGGTNPEIQVFFDGSVVDTEPFLPTTTPANQFTGTKAAPPATPTVDVYAQAIAPWGDSFPGGQVSTTVTVTLPTNCTQGIGRFTGGGKQVTVNLVNGDPVAVTKGFEVDCDLHTPSNNLEINWEGNQFHMTSFNSAVCSYTGPPNPPTAPVNTIIGMGTGRYDGADGYTVVFELIDNGEPGTHDEASFVVYQTSNPSNVILSIPLKFISTGNIQAHVDQK